MAKKDTSSKVMVVKVAERAEVSLGAFSRVMNNDIHVAPDARERVSVIMRELGYVANLVKGILTNTSFPLVLIDQQGTGSLCPAVGARYGMPGEEPDVVDYAGYRLPVCA